jgi:hypothetical protein
MKNLILKFQMIIKKFLKFFHQFTQFLASKTLILLKVKIFKKILLI